MIKRYQFDVPCTYYYEVNAESEEEARESYTISEHFADQRGSNGV